MLGRPWWRRDYTVRSSGYGLMRGRPFGQGLEPWVGARELGDVQSEVNRLFDSFFGRSAQGATLERAWAPAADMYETKDELMIKTDLPGMSEKDVQVSITGDLLSLKGQRMEAEVEAAKPTEIKIDVL